MRALLDGPVWRFVAGGDRRHQLTADGATAVCGHRPWASWEWLGESEVHRREMAKLPDCRSCVRMAGCRHVACVAARDGQRMPWSWRQTA